MNQKLVTQAITDGVLNRAGRRCAGKENAIRTFINQVCFTSEYIMRRDSSCRTINVNGDVIAISDYQMPKVFSEMAKMSKVFMSKDIAESYQADPLFNAQDGVTVEKLVAEWRSLDIVDDNSMLNLKLVDADTVTRTFNFYSTAYNCKMETAPIKNTTGIAFHELAAFNLTDGNDGYSYTLNNTSNLAGEIFSQLLEIQLPLPKAFFMEFKEYGESCLIKCVDDNSFKE